MIIKLAILDNDPEYLHRVSSALQTRYSDKVEVYTFTDAVKAMDKVRAFQTDIFLASGDIRIDARDIPDGCGFAYLVEASDIERYNDHKAICKYQKIDLLYNAIANIHADSSTDKIVKGAGKLGLPVYAFTSACGGAGTTSIAAAAAIQLAMSGRNPLFISLDGFGNPDVFFTGEGQAHFGDIIFALKSQKANLALKLESAAKRDASGVWYYSAAVNALDMEELKDEEVEALFGALNQSNFCDCVVIDAALDLNEIVTGLLYRADRVIFISNGSDIANAKLERAYRALKVLESGRVGGIMSKAALFYNMFKNRMGIQPVIPELPVIGGAPRYAYLSSAQVVKKLSERGPVSLILDHLTGGGFDDYAT